MFDCFAGFDYHGFMKVMCLVLFLCLSCTPAVETQAEGLQPGEVMCPSFESSYAGLRPLLVYKEPHGNILVACGYSLSQGYDLFVLDQHRNFATPLYRQDTLTTTHLHQSAKGLYLEETLWYGGREDVAFFRKDIQCASNGCKVSSPTCIFENPTSIVLDQKKIRLYNKKFLHKEMYRDTLVSQIFDMALSGYTEAQDVFLKDKKSPWLDASASEVYEISKNWLKQMQEHNCLPTLMAPHKNK